MESPLLPHGQGITVRLPFAFFLPLIAVLVPLLSQRSNTPVHVQTSITASEVPVEIRWRLERALSAGGAMPLEAPIVWERGSVDPVRGGHFWLAERQDRQGLTIRAIANDAQGEVVAFSYESGREEPGINLGNGKTHRPLRTPKDVKVSVSTALQRLSHNGTGSWQLTSARLMHGSAWSVRGIHAGHSFLMLFDSRTGALQFYSTSPVRK